MQVQSGCFANLTLLLFGRSCCCPYMYVWILGYHGNKKALNLKLILLATMLLCKAARAPDFAVKESMQ